MVTPMLPELHVGLHTSLGVAAWAAMPAYQIPFASCVIVSGTLGERWGRRRTMLMAYALYPWASLVCVFAESVSVFLVGRGLQGVANAFLTPLLLATLSDAVPRGRLCRVLGSFASMQAAGQAFAPLVGGIAATVDYRLAFLASVFAAAGLAFIPVPATRGGAGAGAGAGAGTGRGTEDAEGEREGASSRRAGASGAGPWRVLLNRRLAVTCLVGFCLYETAYGVMLLASLRAGDHFGLSPGGAGMVVAAFGIAGLVGGSALGRLAARVGMIRFGTASLLALAGAAALAGQVGGLLALVAVVAACGICSTGARIVVNTLAVTSTPANRGGATSITLAGLFLGSAAAPLICLPMYRIEEGLGLLAAASGGMAGALILIAAFWRRRRRILRRKGPQQQRAAVATGNMRTGPDAVEPCVVEPGVSVSGVVESVVVEPRVDGRDARESQGGPPQRKSKEAAARRGKRRPPPGNQPRRRRTAKRAAARPTG